MTELKKTSNRLNYSGDLAPVIDRLCVAYEVGEKTKISIIEIGYEDCNVIIETANNKYVAKIFSKDRNRDTISRYCKIMEAVIASGVNHPLLLKTNSQELVYTDNDTGISMVLMEFINGHSFLELSRAPNRNELQKVVEQAAVINRIAYHPPYLFDSWAIPHINLMFDKVREFINPNDRKLVELAMAQFAEIPIKQLPHCFVHGDFTKANILKGDDDKIYVLDFSVANWYPRIQELAIISANLLHNGTTSLREKTDLVIREYDKFNPLTPEEKQHLCAYALAGLAMEFIGAHKEKFINGNATEETAYWLDLGRSGLIAEFGH